MRSGTGIVINKKLVETSTPAERVYELRDSKLKGFLLRVYPSGKKVYVCQYARGKRMNIGPADALTPIQARDRAQKILAEHYSGIDPMASRRASRALTLKEFLNGPYKEWAETNLKTKNMNADNVMRAFPDLLNKKLDDIRPFAVQGYINKTAKSGTKPASINRYVNSLKSVLSRAVALEFIRANPLAGVKQLHIDATSRVRYLDKEEEKALRAALDAREALIRRERISANMWRRERGYGEYPDLEAVSYVDHLKPLVLLSLNTGLRRGEALSLKWRNVELNRALLTLDAADTKNRKVRHIPLNKEALEVLRQWREQSHKDALYVFAGRSGGPLVYATRGWAKVLRNAGISEFRWHDMRHHFASRLVMEGVDLNTVRELLGHGDIKTTLRYAHLAPEIKAEAVARLVRKAI